jgi:succinate-semialdehyde dehydrogenase / glutarate-semialdehyde dehydrogenase
LGGSALLVCTRFVRVFKRITRRGVMAIATVNPATGETLKTFEPLSDAQVEKKLQRAACTFAEFRNTSFADRAARMIKAAELLESSKQDFARVMTTEMGKTYRSAVDEVAKCAWVCRYYAQNAEKFLADEIADVPGSKSFVRYLPLGPIFAVMPWNYPFWQVFRFIGPSLMAGNVGLLKHASNVPQSALLIEDVLLRAGFPEGVFQTLLIGSSKVGKILADPRVKAATLTGSEGAGVQVGIAAATDIKKVVLEERPVHRDEKRRPGAGCCSWGESPNTEQRSVVHCGEALHRCRRHR